MWKWILLLLTGGAATLGGWLYFRTSRPPEISFERPRVEQIESFLTTNGKIEPVSWVTVRAETPGVVAKVFVEEGQRVGQGEKLAAMSAREPQAELAAAEARLAQAQAEVAVLERGGRPAEIAAIESEIARAELERSQAARDLATIERLLSQRAATQVEADAARDRLERAKSQIAAAEARRRALVFPADLESARARLAEAQAAAKLARERIALREFSAPLAGAVFELAVRPGSFVEVGAPIASVGDVSRVRAILYVDEPDLGHLRPGLPVTLTWDALPGREWVAAIRRVPSQVAPLGTRQVGEVVCELENPGGTLLPGTNINARIRTGRSESALTIPRGALRRLEGTAGVYVLDQGRVRWRPLSLGLASAARVEVLSGLSAEEAVALPAGQSLVDGMAVTPVFP